MRNLELSGNPLGFDSAHGDGRYRVRNDRLGWDVTFSNATRGLSAHLAFRDPAHNQLVYESVLAAHRFFGLNPSAPANTNHEANSPNRWQLLLLALALPFALRVAPTAGSLWAGLPLGCYSSPSLAGNRIWCASICLSS